MNTIKFFVPGNLVKLKVPLCKNSLIFPFKKGIHPVVISKFKEEKLKAYNID